MRSFSNILVLLTAATATALPNIKRQDGPAGEYTVTVTVPATSTKPTPAAVYDWRAGSVDEYPIHASCNATERAQLHRALQETVDLASHARDHILRHGNSSAFYTKYFGDAPTGEAIGWFSKLVSADKAGMWFRCDDVDGNCHQEGWGGHWRGENATSETVICPLSYETRKSLDGMCGFGYTVAASKLATYWAGDLMHRIFHLPPVGEGFVDHFADSYAECVELAKTNPAEAVRNTHSLQYFALDVYAYDLAVPGEGCTGKAPTPTTEGGEASQTTSAPAECHTHDNGVVHCS